MPWTAKRLLKAMMVLAAVVGCISTTSAHFEYASTTIRNVLSRNGPAKSMCRRSQGLAGPCPRMHGCNGRSLLHCKTSLARLHQGLQILRYAGPPDMTPGESLHPRDSHVLLVQFRQNLSLQGLRNDDSPSPHQTTFLHGQFCQLGVIRSQLRWYMGRPSTHHERVDLAEHRVPFGSPPNCLTGDGKSF